MPAPFLDKASRQEAAAQEKEPFAASMRVSWAHMVKIGAGWVLGVAPQGCWPAPSSTAAAWDFKMESFNVVMAFLGFLQNLSCVLLPGSESFSEITHGAFNLQGTGITFRHNHGSLQPCM